VLTVTLLHPVQSTPVQSWTFEQESAVRIGRAMDNQVVLYSAVVSRHHVELRNTSGQWEVVNLGTNGTYLDGKRINQAPLEDGGIIRLARSGPNLQVRLGNPAAPLPSHKVPAAVLTNPGLAGAEAITPDKATMVGQEEGSTPEASGEEEAADDEEDDPEFYVAGSRPLPFKPPASLTHTLAEVQCQHPNARPQDSFCIDCGYPLKVDCSFGPYQVIQPLGNSGTSYLAWRDGQTVVLKTIALDTVSLGTAGHSRLPKLFRKQVNAVCQLHHSGLPQVYEGFAVNGQPFLATEMVFGTSLWQKVSTSGPIPQAQALQWLVQLCHVLDYLHRQTPPLIHQSFCPSNLILPTVPRSGYEIVLVDLGSVLLASPEIKTFVHDVAYTAPELQTGQGQAASDLYALGVTLAYLLTAQEPDHFFRWGSENYRLYVEDIPRINPNIAQLIHRLTHPQPEARPESALAVAQELQKLL
jgi:eukaryotic-like serine/threonine-protein kinase